MMKYCNYMSFLLGDILGVGACSVLDLSQDSFDSGVMPVKQYIPLYVWHVLFGIHIIRGLKPSSS
jgi:hypothetical protein